MCTKMDPENRSGLAITMLPITKGFINVIPWAPGQSLTINYNTK